jgi:hypothetical protein
MFFSLRAATGLPFRGSSSADFRLFLKCPNHLYTAPLSFCKFGPVACLHFNLRCSGERSSQNKTSRTEQTLAFSGSPHPRVLTPEPICPHLSYISTHAQKLSHKYCVFQRLLKYWLNNLTPWSRVLLEKLIVTHLSKKFPALNGTRMFITFFTKVRHWTLSWHLWL